MGKMTFLRKETIGKYGKQIKNEYNDDTIHTNLNFSQNEFYF